MNEQELKFEEDYLNHVIEVIRKYLSSMGQDLMKKEEAIKEFQKFTWDNKTELDPQELQSLTTASEMEFYFFDKKAKYFRTLFKIQNSPYFGSIIFKDESNQEYNVYIGITYLEENDQQLIYDWRSPICSLFYDYEPGLVSYIAPKEIVKGELLQKRQYKIENGKLLRVLDNSINIDDDLLQEVLATDSDEKMKNIVNTIQAEQNKIIRNVLDRTLIVQGIAGSGKTSIALHRIAFLLYKIPNLNSNNVLIFSPNQIFTEYISNVLPELGEDNTMQTTFHDFFQKEITEYKKVESFTDFIARYYTYKENNKELVKYKQRDLNIDDLVNYVNNYVHSLKFKLDILLDNNFFEKEELNQMFHHKYDKLPLFERLEAMAIKLSELTYNGSKKKKPSYLKLLMESLNLKKDFKQIYYNFYKSKYCKLELSNNEIIKFINAKQINYEDASIFVYLKGLLSGFNYNNEIKEIVIDEAQDYTKIQYLIVKKIFNNCGFTILGDVNQTINPYYKYDSLTTLMDIFNQGSMYLELTKTYRSSEEIIAYTNQILNLNHVRAIRKSNNKPVLLRKEENNLKELLTKDISYLKEQYKSVAIIAKDNTETKELFDLVKNDFAISLIENGTETFNKELIIIPAYMAKGLEFDSVIVYNKPDNKFLENEKYLLYVACTRSQHELIVYN